MKKICACIFVFAFAGCTSVQRFPDRWPVRADVNKCPNVSGIYSDRGQRGDIMPGNYDPGRHLSKILNSALADVGDVVEIVQTAKSMTFSIRKDGLQLGNYVISGGELECKNGAVSTGETRVGASLGYWSVLLGNKNVSFSLLEDSSLAVREGHIMGGLLLFIPVIEASNKWTRFQRVNSNDEIKR
jgi:hypothetical protein